MTPRRLAALTLGGALLVAACGDDVGTTESAPTTSAPVATTAPASSTAAPAADADTAGEAPATTSAPEATAAPAEAPASTAAAVEVPEGLMFTARELGGGEINGADFVDMPTLFWFWAPW